MKQIYFLALFLFAVSATVGCDISPVPTPIPYDEEEEGNESFPGVAAGGDDWSLEAPNSPESSPELATTIGDDAATYSEDTWSSGDTVDSSNEEGDDTQEFSDGEADTTDAN